MPYCDPRDGFFYPTLTLMIDSYIPFLGLRWGYYPDQYSNLFLNAYIIRHANTEYLKMIEVYSPCGIWHVFLYSIYTNIYHIQSMKYRQYT